MAEYKKRWIAGLLKAVIAESPVTVISGARQVGKTTLLRNELKAPWHFLSLDDYDVQSQLKRDPAVILENHSHLILDEVQRMPELFPLIKSSVDKNPDKRCVLSGSANLLLMSKVSESLAGRAEYLDIEPMSRGECAESSPPESLISLITGRQPVFRGQYVMIDALPDAVWKGGMPVILHRDSAVSLNRWRDGYTAAYLERDLRQLSQVENLADFKKLMQAAALYTGGIVNQSSLARDTGLTQPTVHRYLNLLEMGKMIHRLPVYRAGRTSRLAKSPKMMWADSGLACHLAGFYEADTLRKSREWGRMLECFVYSQLRALCALISPKPVFYTWRTQKGEEADLIIEYGQRATVIEIKSSTRARYEDTAGLQRFRKECPVPSAGILFYNGSDVLQMGEGLAAVPLGVFF